MVMWSRLMVNNTPIGFIEIKRLSGGARCEEDAVNEYRVRIREDTEMVQTTITHRYGDGPMVLLRKALEEFEDERQRQEEGTRPG